MVARVAGELTEIGNADLGLRAQLQITAGFDQRSIARDRAPMPSKLKVAGSNPARVANKIYMLERIPQRFSWQAPSWSPALPLSVDACLALEMTLVLD